MNLTRSQAIFALGLLALGLLAQTAEVTLADRGRGSIRAEGRSAPAPARVEERPSPAAVHVDAPRREPDVRRDAAPARVPAPAVRDWDDNDEDGRHFGGFAPTGPVRAVRGQRFHNLPPAHVDLHYRNANFFFDNVGCFYQQQPDGEYLVVQPPIGIVVGALPPGVVPIIIGPTTYDYLDGIFYVAQPGGFAVVSPPPGTVVPTLPSGATQVVVNGTVAYQFDGFNYLPSLQDGVTVYTVTPM